MTRALIISIAVAVGILVLHSGQLKAEIYTWTDENGVKHYSNHPPSDAENAVVTFKEYQYDPATDQQRFEVEQQQWDSLINQIEADDREAAEEAQRRREAARKNRQPTLEERAAAEKERLLKQIAELEQKPLDYFGSQDNKRIRLGYYRYRLEALTSDPAGYFNNPKSFEGNVKIQETN